MASYQFDPVKVEFSFGRNEPSLPAWELDLGDGHTLAFGGVIDRVDLDSGRNADSARCVVVDYKSSFRKIDPLLLKHGIQIQLPAYLAVLRRLEDTHAAFGVKRLIPAGVFYVNLRGSFSRAKSRIDAATENGSGGDPAYQHEGRFDLEALPQLDSQGAAGGAKSGQFNYRLTNKGEPYKNSPSIMRPEEFASLLDRMGASIYHGDIQVDPYLNGGKTPCEWCDYASICRIDPWLHRYRVLRRHPEPV
jgi:ATP-dependent helicase/nuclease subunit B